MNTPTHAIINTTTSEVHMLSDDDMATLRRLAESAEDENLRTVLRYALKTDDAGLEFEQVTEREVRIVCESGEVSGWIADGYLLAAHDASFTKAELLAIVRRMGES